MSYVLLHRGSNAVPSYYILYWLISAFLHSSGFKVRLNFVVFESENINTLSATVYQQTVDF